MLRIYLENKHHTQKNLKIMWYRAFRGKVNSLQITKRSMKIWRYEFISMCHKVRSLTSCQVISGISTISWDVIYNCYKISYKFRDHFLMRSHEIVDIPYDLIINRHLNSQLRSYESQKTWHNLTKVIGCVHSTHLELWE